MKSEKQQYAQSIRFRRWSRAGYAVFCSLACSVTIGCLAISISDKSLQKAVGSSIISHCVNGTAIETSVDLSEIADLEIAIQQLQEANLTSETFESAAACGINIFII
jgi:hypothetical protein